MKRGGVCFNPVDPPEIMKDPEDSAKEQPEPTPLEWPKEPEAKPEGEEGEGEGEEDD